MPDASTRLPPGSMTVPPWFGWETVALVVTVLLVSGVVFLVVGATRAGAARRDEWRALLEARSTRGGGALHQEHAPRARQTSDAPSR